jgi:glucokinase
MIDARGALVGTTPHLPHWTDFPVAERVASALGLPVRVENDANCAAWAEHQLGAARGARTSITVTVGTGVGCGIVLDGRLYRGAHGGAGEVGHLPIGPLGSGCTCGVEGCAEPWMSGEGLGLAARGAGLGAIDASELFALAERGNRVARSLVERLADRLGAALASAIHVIDPEVVVLGGGVSAAGAPLVRALAPALDRYVMTSHRGRQRVELAALGERAGAIGAALLAGSQV